MKKKPILTQTEDLTLALAALLLAAAFTGAAHSRRSTAVTLTACPLPEVTLAPALRLDPNKATAGQLEELPGIGPVLAGRILAQRERGPIDGPEDLLAVEGLGEAKLEAIEPYIIYSGGEP